MKTYNFGGYYEAVQSCLSSEENIVTVDPVFQHIVNLINCTYSDLQETLNIISKEEQDKLNSSIIDTLKKSLDFSYTINSSIDAFIFLYLKKRITYEELCNSLESSAKKGNIDGIELLLEIMSKENISLDKKNFLNLEVAAIKSKKIEIVHIFEKLGMNFSGITCYFIIEFGNLEILKYFSYKIADNKIYHCLSLCCCNDNIEIFKYLYSNLYKNDTLFIDAIKKNSIEIAKFLYKKEKFHIKIGIWELGSIEMVKFCLQNNLTDSWYPYYIKNIPIDLFMFIVKQTNITLTLKLFVDFIIQRSYIYPVSDFYILKEHYKNICHDFINAAFMAVITNVGEIDQKKEMLKVLLENGADIHRENERALKFAIDTKNYSIIDFLLENGADIKKLIK